jgi:hypothetical protein
MSWRFQLAGDEVDLKFLSWQFPIHESVRVSEAHGRFALEADALDQITGDLVTRLKAAESMVDFVNGWAVTQDSSQRAVWLTGSGTDGSGAPYVVNQTAAATATARMVANASVTINGVLQTPTAPGAGLVTEAAINQALSDLLTLIGSHPHDFYTLYKVHEIIEEDTKGGLYRAWTTKDESDAFTAAANNRGATGLNARHATTRKPPRKVTPMTLVESRQYVLRLANNYLRWVADGRPIL